MSALYELFGLRVRSELDLPELFAAESGDVQTEIRFGTIPARPGERPGLSVHQDGALLSIPDVGRYLVRDGREIVVEPLEGASDRNIRLFLLGSAFGAILHQRGLLPLHANAVEIDGRAVAFMGHSGAGKSTIAAWFLDRGARVLADDVCVVTLDGSGRPLAHPGVPRLRLWRQALEVTGRSAEEYELSFDNLDKYNVPTPRPEFRGALPLDHIYLLEKGEGAEPSIRRLAGVEAADALIANTYRGGYVPLMGLTRQHFGACMDLVRRVPIFAARRLWGFDRFEEQAEALRSHARGLIESSLSPERA